MEGSNASSEGTVISPRRKNPKKAIVQAARSMMVLGSSWVGDHRDLSWRKIRGDMGSLGRPFNYC